MAIFDFSNFEREGNTENDIQLSTLEHISEAVVDITSSTLRTIKIFTPDLERDIYNHDALKKNMLDFSRGNRHAQIQLMVMDTSNAVNEGHILLNLAQQLTSCMSIKITPEDYQSTNFSFLLVDQSSFIFRPDAKRAEAIQSSCKHRIEKLDDFFTPAWDQAEVDIHSRRFSI